MAGRRLMRLDVRRDNSYTRRRAWTRELPTEPATVMLYDNKTKLTRCLVADFDIAKKGAAFAAAEANAFAKVIESCGGRVIIDRSPSGGRHVIVFLATPRHISTVKPFMQALDKRYSTLDIGPMTNPETGSIRPPGSAHRRGGHQLLVTDLHSALLALKIPNGDHVWRALLSNIGPVEIAPVVQRGTFEEYATDPRWRGRKGWLHDEQAEIARTGSYDHLAHPTWTPSEARMSVVGGAFRAGWLLPEVVAQMEPGGSWQGLRQLYDRHSGGRPKRRLDQLVKEWSKAKAYSEISGAHRSDTRGLHHAPPCSSSNGEYIWLREWWTGMRLTERDRYAGREGHAVRLVLRAMGCYAQRRGSRYVSVGVRSLALACGLHRTTVGRALEYLREQDQSPVRLIDGRANGGRWRGEDRPDVYELVIPEQYQREASSTPWRPGKFEAIHHAFIELGVPAAFVYESLGEHGYAPMTAVDVAESAMVSRRAAEQALNTLAAYELAERCPGGWRRGPAGLDHVGEQLETREEFERRRLVIEQERQDHKEWLKTHGEYVEEKAPFDQNTVDRWATGVHEPPDDFEPDDVVINLPEEVVVVLPRETERELEEALDLLEREVGAVALPP